MISAFSTITFIHVWSRWKIGKENREEISIFYYSVGVKNKRKENEVLEFPTIFFFNPN